MFLIAISRVFFLLLKMNSKGKSELIIGYQDQTT